MKNKEYVLVENRIFSSIEKNIAFGLLAFWLSYVAGLLTLCPPYWALMDDHGLLAGIGKTKEGFFLWIADFVKGYRDWGMFRPMYGVFIYFFYTIFQHSSFLAYLFIFFVNGLIFSIWSEGFVRCLRYKIPEKSDQAVWRILFVILCFHYIRNNNLFYFASLQERGVIFFVGIAILSMANLPEKYLGFLKWMGRAGLVLALLSLAFLSKAPAVVFVLLFTLWFLAKGYDDRNNQIPYIITALSFVLAFVFTTLFFYSIRTGYSAGYQANFIFKELSDSGSKFYRIMVLALLTMGLTLFNRFRFKGGRGESGGATALFQELFWPLGMIAYTVLMLPWQGFLNYYLIIPVGMFSVGTKLILFNEITRLLNRWKKLPYGLFFIFGIAVTSITPMWKFYQKAIHHHGTGKAVEYLMERIEKDGEGLTIRVAENCEETASALGNFLNKPGLTPMARSDDPFYKDPPVPGEKKLLVTHRECPEFPETFAPTKVVFRYGEWVIYEQVA